MFSASPALHPARRGSLLVLRKAVCASRKHFPVLLNGLGDDPDRLLAAFGDLDDNGEAFRLNARGAEIVPGIPDSVFRIS
jgi:hypothetical protein